MPAEPFTVQRLRGGYAIVWNEGGTRHRRQLASTDRKSAEAEARKLWAEADGDSSPWTVGRVMTAYLDSIAEKPSHQRRKDAWKAMKPFWEDVDPALIDPEMCRQYRRARKVSDTTARYELQQLSTALGSASKHIGPRPDLWFPPAPEHKMRHLTRDEFGRFFGCVKADHARLYVMIGLHTVARPSAILQLTWDRVDFMRRLIDFTPPGHVRTSKRRTVVPISDALLPELQKGHAARTCDYVIERGGKQVANIKKAFQAASKRSTVHATPYTLRHTGAVWAAEAGVPMAELSQFMGHDRIETTIRHYARYSPGYLVRVANAIGGAA
jgi:integrase